MHFGPEWMRTKPHPSSRSQPPPSPPLATAPISGASTYSALVSPTPPTQPEKRDEAHPFRYSKEEMLRIYKEGGGRGGLGIEVERWEGVVRESGTEPIGLREMDDSEKKVRTAIREKVFIARSYIVPISFLQRLSTLTSVDASPPITFLRFPHRL